jgi:hypothetical protein
MARLNQVAGLGIGGHRRLHGTERSAAEMPVVTPSAASIDTVKAVEYWRRCAPPWAGVAAVRSAARQRQTDQATAKRAMN